MRPITCFTLITLIILVLSSCTDELKLYHEKEEPQIKWLLKTVGYPDENPGFTSRPIQTFYYTDNDLVNKIKNPTNDSLLKIDYKADRISLSRMAEYSNYTLHDSIILVLNTQKQAKYALHVRYYEYQNGQKTKNTDDSTIFTYDAGGYMIQFDRYSVTGVSQEPSHTEKYTILDGNIVESNTATDIYKYKYTYTYDNKDHVNPAEYCYEMPRFTSSLTNCWLFTNMSFLSDYFGKRSKNNIIRTVAERSPKKDDNYTPYGDITYEYTFNENNLVTAVKMSGVSKTNNEFVGLTTTFSYYKIEIYE